MDTLRLNALRYKAPHGYHEEERRRGNTFEVDLRFEGDFRQAGRSDELEHALDYQQAETAVRSVMEGPSVKLLETLALRIGERLLAQHPQARRIEVAVRKMDPPLPSPASHSEIRMSWTR
ncbi:MAG: dihydroneopterin aldolase [Balneolaceae bacterium]|nr:dihydroneopterin aldolase [Balneolaceae bacterium]